VLEHYVRQALSQAGIRPNPKRGQNFLVDDGVLAHIISAAQLEGNEYVIEVGPGVGALTRSLARRCRKLAAFEIDEVLIRYLRNWVLPEEPNIVLYDQAFNKYKLENILEEAKGLDTPVKFVTNLPYQISAAFLHSVIEYSADIESTVVMLQREVATRITAKPGDTDYSSFSIYLQAMLAVQWVCDVPASSFVPRPKVESAVVKLTNLDETRKPKPIDPELFAKLVERMFLHRRKHFANSLSLAYPHLREEEIAKYLEASAIDPAARPQELPVSSFVRLADEIAKARLGN